MQNTNVNGETEYQWDDYAKDTLTKPRDLAWDNWGKFENEGDKVQGYIADVFYRPAEGMFKEQRGITIKQVNGEYINVGIKPLTYVMSKTDGLRIGDPLTVVYEKTMAPQQKGYKGAKIFGYYGKNLDANKDNQTVLEAYNEDKAKGGYTPQDANKANGDVTFEAVNDDPLKDF